MRKLLAGLSLLFWACAPNQTSDFPPFDKAEDSFLVEKPKKSSSDFPEFAPRPVSDSLLELKGIRPFIRVLVGEKKKTWKTPGTQRLEFFAGDPLHSGSRKILQTSSQVVLSSCYPNVCLKSDKGSKTAQGPIWYHTREEAIKDGTTSYKGLLHVIPKKSGRLQVVNFLPLEDYVKGILPYEIGALPEWGFEALKAQAVAARTYTLRNLEPLDGHDFDLYNDTRDQVYRGRKAQTPMTDRAVEATRGMVLTYQNTLAETYYFSTSGGTTSDITRMWGGEKKPYLNGVKDFNSNGKSWSHESRWHRWSLDFSKTEILKTVNKNLKRLKLDKYGKIRKLKKLEVLGRTPSGRVQHLGLHTEHGLIKIRGDRTRWAFHPKKINLSILPSAHFKVKNNGSTVQISGRGFGHGIGLCQMGARARSKAGQGFDTILTAYYPKTHIKYIPM